MPSSVGGRVAKVLLLSLAVGLLLAGALGPVTYRISGAPGFQALAAALLISLLSNVAGCLPACWYLAGSQAPAAKSVLSGMVIRLIVLLLLAAPAVLSARLPQEPFLLWLAGGYLAMLMVETVVVTRWMNNRFQVQLR